MDAKAAGYTLLAESGYRSYATQVTVYNSEIRRFGQAKADTESARPGYSEHQTGWAVDIQTPGCLEDCFSKSAAASWLQTHSFSYGFIVRYQEDKEVITGYPNGQHVTIVGAVMGSPDLGSVMKASEVLLRSAIPGFKSVNLLKKDQLVGTYKTPWGQTATATAGQDITLLLWATSKTRLDSNIRQLSVPTKDGTEVGQILIQAGGVTKNVSVVLRGGLSPPTAAWRLTHFL